MYGLPAGIDLRFLAGCTLEHVGIGQFTMSLVFDRQVNITVEQHITCVSSQNTATDYTDYKEAAPDILSNLGYSIAAFEAAEDGTLTIQFDSECAIILHDDNEQYEAYQIAHGDDLIVV